MYFSCPENWIDSEQGCFFFANEELGMDWHRAVDYCKDLDAYLAEVLDNEIQTLLATEASLLPPTNWWIGASDEENVSTFKYSNM
jgi:hypothetical protein